VIAKPGEVAIVRHVTGLAAPESSVGARAQLLWEEEVVRLCASAPTLPQQAKDLMRATLVAILDEAGPDASFARSAQPLLAALGSDSNPELTRPVWREAAAA
jgi:hypothetical protein